MTRTIPTLADLLKKAEAHGRRGDPVSAREWVEKADKQRREVALTQDPAFPEAWGEPLAKWFEVPCPDGAQRVVPIRPDRPPHLTFWRFDNEIDVCATFDRLVVDDDPANWERRIGPRKFVVVQAAVEPPVPGEWVNAGPTDNLSHLWIRDRLTRGRQ